MSGTHNPISYEGEWFSAFACGVWSIIMTEHDSENLRRVVETFDDGHQSICCYDAAGWLARVETRSSDNSLKIAISYHYDEAGNNILRVVRDARGIVLREIHFDSSGVEIGESEKGPVRWKSMDGTEEGVAEPGKEDVYPPQQRDS